LQLLSSRSGVERQVRHIKDRVGNQFHVHAWLWRHCAVSLKDAAVHALSHLRGRVADINLPARDVVLSSVERNALGQPGNGVLRGSIGRGIGPRARRRSLHDLSDHPRFGGFLMARVTAEQAEDRTRRSNAPQLLPGRRPASG